MTNKENNTPHYHGHRERLKDKFRNGGAKSLSDYELLELILFQTISRKDVKPLAKEMINKFGGFAEVVSAPISLLEQVNGISKNTATAIKAIEACSIKLSQEKIINKSVLQNWQQVLDYCHSSMAWKKEEQFRVLYLNRKNVLIADEVQSEGTLDYTPVYPREIVKRSLDLGASAIILVHNHPSGSNSPSKDDILMTKELKKTLNGIDVSIHDHIIISREGHYSFKSNMII
ncbi:MAG: DNA repair protein RadC [Alphaproteobacteria bacterium]|jgi:DNA repair protein RadC|nr:DNA repair protein RadC [Alphaproteobacteria bacterium]MCV6599426.1 DNA repair protein RadC [Alphaproteobacteria bacterium]